ncbi:hypothetical protein Q7V72_10330, partial [Streptococcus suis]|nr:hypothetical protein [Streptococcus suis]
YNRKKKWKLKALAATSIAGGFLVFLYEKNWLEAIIKNDRMQYPVALFFRIYIFFNSITISRIWAASSKSSTSAASCI